MIGAFRVCKQFSMPNQAQLVRVDVIRENGKRAFAECTEETLNDSIKKLGLIGDFKAPPIPEDLVGSSVCRYIKVKGE